jgi:3-(3-hydroxy-phenyl)propionate hydroxylase
VIDAIQYCDPVRPTTFVPMPGQRHRWEFMLMPQDDPATITRPERIYELLKPWRIDPTRSKIERGVVYTFHSALATCWRRDRLLLAGDSAHQTPPFLGQGMCSGLRDAANLAWKLRDVIAGRASEQLLDTYETERMQHVRAFIELAVELGGIIQATDPDIARRRDAELIANPTMLRPITPGLGPGLHGDAPPPAGTRAAQPRLGDGARIDDRVGYHFAVLANPQLTDALTTQLIERINQMGATLVPADGDAADYLSNLNAEAIVIRPDRHILGIATNPVELEALLMQTPWQIADEVETLQRRPAAVAR